MNFRPHTLAIAVTAMIAGQAAHAQAFSPGNLIVSRTVYTGNASTVTVGQALPGGGTAIADGTFPNVFKNEVPDASFGVTSPIFLDQLTRVGTFIGSQAIDASMVTTSFASKSELAINVSTDGQSITFMGYKAPKNALDISNSNTQPANVAGGIYFDPTNPVGLSYQRAVVQVGLSSGSVQVTGINGYSGNNGRAAVLSGGNYYTVGNAGNGNGNGTVLSNLSDYTGVQRIAVGQSGDTTPVGAPIGSFGSTTGYQRGFGLQQVQDPTKAQGINYAADKTGKDDNFRGMTVFGDTLYVTKGSGSNGIDTVYQVGAKAALANDGSIGNAAITILPGFNAVSEKVIEGNAGTPNGVWHPFGLWFANSTTLFVADEGDGVRIGQLDKNGKPVPKSTLHAGLEEWTFDGAKWNNVATFQSGLIDQGVYSQGLPWSVKTDGLRNLTGVVNSNGSFTLYATTSTISDEQTHDLGADPNQIVSITIGAGSTADNTSFTVLRTAAAGERFGGVALAPVPEPSSYALMLAGLGGLALRMRRRKADR